MVVVLVARWVVGWVVGWLVGWLVGWWWCWCCCWLLLLLCCCCCCRLTAAGNGTAVVVPVSVVVVVVVVVAPQCPARLRQACFGRYKRIPRTRSRRSPRMTSVNLLPLSRNREITDRQDRDNNVKRETKEEEENRRRARRGGSREDSGRGYDLTCTLNYDAVPFYVGSLSREEGCD